MAQLEIIPSQDVYVRYYSKKYNKSMHGSYPSLFSACRDIAAFIIEQKYPCIGITFCVELHKRLSNFLFNSVKERNVQQVC